MSRITGTTHAQTLFLRAFRTNPAGPPPDAWPSPAILRKWLRRPAFRTALRSVQAALRFRADFHLAAAADNAAQRLTSAADPAELKKLADILRLAHLRQRFPAAADATDLRSPATFALRQEIRGLETEIHDLRELADLENRENEDDDDDDHEEGDQTLLAIDLEHATRRLAELRAKIERRQ